MKKTIAALVTVASVAGSLTTTPACSWQRQRFWDGSGWRVRQGVGGSTEVDLGL